MANDLRARIAALEAELAQLRAALEAGGDEPPETDAERRARLGLGPSEPPIGKGHGGGLYMPRRQEGVGGDE